VNVAKVLAVTVLAGSVSIGLALFGERWLDDEIVDAEQARRSLSGGVVETLPDLRLTALDGDQVSSSAWAGKPVVLNFWATWCPPCRREMPLLDDWQQRYADRGLHVIGIAIDRREQVAGFLEDHAVSYPILLGDMDTVALSKQLGNRTGGLPFTVVFDRVGRRVADRTGEIDDAFLEAEVRPLLPERDS
jgi:thiol-disulfide isomerase/thioredoxin